MKIQRKFTTGNWTKEDRIDLFVEKIIERETWYAERVNREPMCTKQQVLDMLATGETINYGDDWYAQIRDADAPRFQSKPVQATKMSKCDGCGYEYPISHIMSASMGKACPDCYDRLSN